MIRTTQTVAAKTVATLLIGVSGIAIATPVSATDTIFSSSQIDVREGKRINQQQGVTQVRLGNGGTASFIDAADFRINADGSIDLYAGGVTVTTGPEGSEALVRMPEGLEGRVAGIGSAANFSVGPDGEARGHALSGNLSIGRQGDLRVFDAGDMFATTRGAPVRQVVSNGAQSTPDAIDAEQDGPIARDPVVAMGGGAGPVAAAQNGLPVSLGDALAAAGASGDILGAARRVEAAVANPAIETFPGGDLRLLVAAAANLEGAFGGTPFPAAQADIIRTYLGFLAGGGSGADFLTAYSGFLTQYFDFIRIGGIPGGFALANVADINAFTSFLARTRGFAEFSAQDRALADAYLAFIANGGNADLFAGSFTDLTEAYFTFLRAGGRPQDFTAASLSTVESYIAFLDASGLERRLSSTDRALLDAYLANGGFGFVGQYRAALDAYFAFLASGQQPSAYDGADFAVLLGYVQTLQSAGLLGSALGERAQFFADYAAFVQGGGQIDAFGQLNANIFAGYADALNAYFAFLDAGGVPSGYTLADTQVLNSYLAQLAAAGAVDRFLGDRSAFFADYLAFLQGGGSIDTYAGLNANIFGGYAEALAAYYAYLENGGIPSAYTALDQDTIRAYLAALARVGATEGFLADLAAFYSEYFAFVTGGGNPDNFAGLPVPPDFPAFASALNAYAAFLVGGGLPSDYDTVDFDLLQNYLEAIVASGQLADLLGANADLLTGYFGYLATGGSADGFSGLPIYATYVSALNAYYAYLQGGGLPSGYTVLDRATIRAYLSALNDAGGLVSFGSLDSFFTAYFAFVAAGNDPARFAGLPIYADYVAALNAYYAFIAEGGTPSAYPVLTQAQVQAYLTALANTSGGGFSNFAALNDFFVKYFAYLGDGGDPDRFAGLPGRGPGGGNGGGNDAPSPQLGSVRGWQFASDALRVARVDAKVAADGRITELTVYNPSGVTTDYSSRTADLREFGRFGDAVAWTRYYVGSANRQQNVSEHLLVGTPAFEIPTAGLIDYALVGGTAPTNRNAAPGSTGWFTGDLAVAFGSAGPRVGFNFDLYSEGTGYRVQTAGGAKGAAAGGLGVNADGVFENQSLGLTVIAGTGCTGYCIGQVFGGLFGKGASHAGFTYNLFDRDRNNALQGVAVFGTAGTRLAGLGTPPDTVSDPGDGVPKLGYLAGDGKAPVGTDGDQAAYINAQAGSAVGLATPLSVEDGVLLGADIARTNYVIAEPTDDAKVQKGGIDGILGWSRVSNFSGSYNSGSGGRFFQAFSSRYLHAAWGTPVKNLPAAGKVNYELVGWTTPTATNATDLTGSTFAGSLAIDFGKLMLGLTGTVDIGSQSYTFSSDGGVTDPSIAISTNPASQAGNVFTASLNTFDGSGNVVSRGTQVSGFLAGESASHVGIVYGIRVASSNTIEGSAAFRAEGFGVSTGVQGAASAIANMAIAPVDDWGRWGAPVSSPIAHTSVSMAMPDGAVSLSSASAPPRPADSLADWSRWTVPGDALSSRMLSIEPSADPHVSIVPDGHGSQPSPRDQLGGLMTFGEIR